MKLTVQLRLLTAFLLATFQVQAQVDYTVWASVIYSRTGERTPEVLGYIPTELTSLGAQEMYNSGVSFRTRYLSSGDSTDGMYSAPLYGLTTDIIDPLQVYVMALDEQYAIASAQAFLQGFYPPYASNATAASVQDATSVLSNGTYVEAPLSGYQYPQIHAAGATDMEFPYVGGSLDCPAFDAAAQAYTNTPQFANTEEISKSVYESVGGPLLSGVLDEDAWDFLNAYAIYDYINYQNAHNTTINALLSEMQYIQPDSNVSFLDALRYYADQQQYAELGNLTAVNTYSSSQASTGLGKGVAGSISTVAGNLLAAKMLAQLQSAIQSSGEFYKLSLLVGDFEPLMSFAAITGLPNIDENFYGLADFGSVAVLELFSYTDGSVAFPSTNDLKVRFYFRNGTAGSDDESGTLQSYPLFDVDRNWDMPWNTFETAMYGVLVGDIGDWCLQCGAQNYFCAAWNSSDALDDSDSCLQLVADRNHLSDVAAGAIGAVIMFVLIAKIFLLVLWLGRVRFHRVPPKNHKSEMGGFKGSQKLASDQDLTITKGGAVMGATVEREGPESPLSPIEHERFGSWELKQTEAGIASGRNIADIRPSFESEERVDPFQEPTKADERV